jgi:hypothetical protein
MKRLLFLIPLVVFCVNADVQKPSKKGKYFDRESVVKLEDGRVLYMEEPKEELFISTTIKGNIYSLKGKNLQCEVIDNVNRLHKLNLIYDLYFRDIITINLAEKAMKERKFIGLVGVIGHPNFNLSNNGTFTVIKVIDAKPDVVEETNETN